MLLRQITKRNWYILNKRTKIPAKIAQAKALVYKYPSLFQLKKVQSLSDHNLSEFKNFKKVKLLNFRNKLDKSRLSKTFCMDLIKNYPDLLYYDQYQESLEIYNGGLIPTRSSGIKFNNKTNLVKKFHSTDRKGLTFLIDPIESISKLNRALSFLKDLSKNQRNILFIVSSKEFLLNNLIKLFIQRTGTGSNNEYCLVDKWVPGLLTNFGTKVISSSHSKRELKFIPDCVVFLDTNIQYIGAVQELKRVNIPSVGLVGPLTDEFYDYRIPANTNSTEVKTLFLRLVTTSVAVK